MWSRIAIIAAVAAVAAAAGVAGGLASGDRFVRPEPAPGEPDVHFIAPRNGARQSSRAVVAKVEVQNFQLAPLRFGGEPLLGEGHLRFSLNRVPDCVDPAKLERAENSPVGRGRLVGASFDFPRFAGPNGLLAKRIGSTGSYSPATRPEIYYNKLPSGLYRLVVVLARNNGSPTPTHAVTNFQILTRKGREVRPCPPGKISSAKAESLD